MTIAEDVIVLLGRDLTDAEATRADRLIEIAVATLESALPGFTLESGAETATIWPGDPDVIWTPRYPVTDVESVTVASTTITAAFAWTEAGCLSLPYGTLTGWPSYIINAPSWGYLPAILTYDFGLDDLPADISAAIATPVANMIRQQATNPSAVQSTTLGLFTESYGDFAVRSVAEGVVAPMIAKRWARNMSRGVPLVGDGVYPGGLQSQAAVPS